MGGVTLGMVGMVAPGAIAQSFPDSSLESDSSPYWIADAAISNQLIFVDPTAGDDATGTGLQVRSPLRTLTRALELATPGTTIVLAPGIYNASNGENFPIVVPAGVTIQGDPSNYGQNILLLGGGSFQSATFATQNATLRLEGDAAVVGVSLANPNDQGYGVWIESGRPSMTYSTISQNASDAVVIVGDSSPTIAHNHFTNNAANGVTVYGTAEPEITQNWFESSGAAVNIAQNSAPVLIENSIRNNTDGVIVQSSAQPVLRGNVIEANTQDGLVAIAQSLPNLGTADDPGNNVIRNNGRYDINTAANSNTIPAFGNQVTTERTTGYLDWSGEADPTAIATLPQPFTNSLQMPQMQSPSANANPRTSASNFPSPTNLSAQADIPSLTTPRFSLYAPISTVIPTTNTDPHPSSVPTELTLVEPAAVEPVTTPEPRTNALPVAPSPEAIALHSPAAIDLPVIAPPPIPSSMVEPPQMGDTFTAVNIPVIAPPATHSGTIAPATPAQPVTTSLALESARSSSNVALLDFTTPIEIPVIPPTAPETTVARASTTTYIPNQSELLPVPDMTIPLGNIGGLPTIPVAGSLNLQALGTVSPRTSLRYRVIVELARDSQVGQIQGLVPGAFETNWNGETVMQVGAFRDRANAEELADMLNSYGFDSMIEALGE
jgi:parallel beta-helix repeat protein